MKVLNVIDGPGWTGGVEQTMVLAGEMRELGLDAEIACHGMNHILVEAPQRGIPTFVYDRGGGRMQRYRALREILKKAYDVVIGHKPAAVRHLILPMYTQGRRPLFIGVRRVSYPVSPLTVYRAADHVVAVSGSVRDVLVTSGLREAAITVVPSGVETERFRFSEAVRRETREKLGLSGSRVLLNLAKFVPAQKGQDVLLNALGRLGGLDNTRLLLAGMDTDGDEARRMVRNHGLEAQVQLLGFRRDIPQLLCAADVFVFPSRPGLDAIAGSVLQAMACERVVVSSRIGGIPEYVVSGSNGYLVEPADATALARTLRSALALDGQDKRSMGRKARETVTAGYSTKAMARSYAGLVERLLAP